jgi:hypothetical protein
LFVYFFNLSLKTFYKKEVQLLINNLFTLMSLNV